MIDATSKEEFIEQFGRHAAPYSLWKRNPRTGDMWASFGFPITKDLHWEAIEVLRTAELAQRERAA